MITNETRAKLIGWKLDDLGGFIRVRRPSGHVEQEVHSWSKARAALPRYDTDANAVAELRAFVRARGKETEFLLGIGRVFGWGIGRLWNNADVFAALNATPQQQTAAFDAVFKDDLERINET